MDKIEVKILDHNLNKNFVTFLAMLTQRGSEINSMQDIEALYKKVVDKAPKEALIKLPHTTIQRMNYVTIAICGLSTKAVSQLRTHAKRCTCISTSTQYSSYENRADNYVFPSDIDDFDKTTMEQAYKDIQRAYNTLLKFADKDAVGYLLPQGLRKAFIMSANIDDWNYILRTRLCHRNTKEVQHICKLIYNAIKAIDPVWVSNALPLCSNCQCPEGNFCCGVKFDKGEVDG